MTTAGGEVFALTDEQIVGLETVETGSETQDPPSQTEGGAPGKFLAEARDDKSSKSDRDAAIEERSLASRTSLGMTDSGEVDEGAQTLHGNSSGQAGVPVPQEAAQPPEWLAARMKDPWHGKEAREFWDGKQRAEKEAATYREVFATPQDARGLKEIYPGGVSEAKSAAFYRGDAGARMALAQKMMAQDAGAFREMVEAGVRLLAADGRSGGAERSFVAQNARQDDNSLKGSQDRGVMSRSLRSESQNARLSGRDDRVSSTHEERTASEGGPYNSTEASVDKGAQPGMAVPQEVVRAYGEMEKAANAELEKSVGVAIGRAMEQALPNLRMNGRDAQSGVGLKERLAGAVREEVETALKSDRELGERVARILAGRRFDDVTRGQVVRLIDARAQQLVPGAVKRVLGSWTQATLAARGTNDTRRGAVESALPVRREEAARKEKARETVEAPVRWGRRVDYGRVTDEEILGL
jgi:hypothetical protein